MFLSTKCRDYQTTFAFIFKIYAYLYIIYPFLKYHFLINSDTCMKPDLQSTSPSYQIPSQNMTRGN